MGLSSSKCVSTVRLDGKTAVITGSNTGIGKCAVQDFFKRGARVVMACRNLDKANAAADEIRQACEGQGNLGEIIVAELDLTSLASVRKCATNLLQKEKRIDLLINNAGVMVCPQGKTKDGFETQFGTNHLGHFLFTLLLMPTIVKSTPARIVNVSSKAHIRGGCLDFNDLNFEKRPYSALSAYCQSKLANILFTKELDRRIKEAHVEGVTVYSLHPGTIATELGRHVNETYFWGLSLIIKTLFGMFMKTPEQGTQTIIYCAVDEEAGKESGLYYEECQVAEPSFEANDMENARKLWDISKKFVELDENYNPFTTK